MLSQSITMASRYVAHRFRSLHPFDVQAMLLNACNLRCEYCRCPEVRTKVMTTAQWLDTIEGLRRVGTLRIKWQGGEPTLREDFNVLGAATRKAGIRNSVITNGTLIPAKPQLLDHVDEIIFSLDGSSAEVNDRLRGNGVHALVVASIDLALARGITVYVNQVITQENWDDVEPMLEFCESRGIKLNAQPVMTGVEFYDNDVIRQRLMLSAENTRTLFGRLAAWQRAGRSVLFQAETYERSGEWADYAQLTTPSDAESSCMAGRYYVHITANGDIRPCIQHGQPFTPKNLLEDGLEHALEHARHHACGNCYTVYLNERKSLFALRPAAVLGVLRRG